MTDEPNRADFPLYTKYGGMSGDHGYGIASGLDKEIVAEYWPAHDPVADFNETRKRLIACWNACIGLPTEDIERRGVCLQPVQANPSTEHAGS